MQEIYVGLIIKLKYKENKFMKEISIKSLALKINTPVKFLIKQFANAGIVKKSSDYINHQEKEILLLYLRNIKNKKYNKFTLKRKTHSVIKISGLNGKNKSINIEVRKNYTYFDNIFEKKSLTCKKDILKVENNKIIENKEKKDELISNIKIYQDKFESKLDEQLNKDILFNKEASYSKKIKKSKKEINKNYLKKFKDLKECDKSDWNYKNDLNNHHNNIENKNFTNKIKNKNTKYNKESLICKEEDVKDIIKKDFLTQSFKKPIKNISKNIAIGETISIAELSNKMAIKASEVIKAAMNIGIFANINQVIDQKTAKLIVEKIGHKVILKRENEIEEFLQLDRKASDNNIMRKRPPIVTIMGHVDHGKTSILDCIRSSNIANKEIGGITQKISAYYVKTKNGNITFLDTPGHIAFFNMRKRGIKITDIIVLVIAIDDGVMPQTIEIIKYAKEEKVPIIVAINKIDKSEVNIDRIKNELTNYDIISDQWGGDTQFINVSAKSGKGINDLLEAIILQSEMLELSASEKIMARGIVLESKLDKGIGPISNIILLEGILKKGDYVLCGIEYGKIRAIRDEYNKNLKSIGPSIPATVIGLSGVTNLGDDIIVVKDEKKAREVSNYRKAKDKEKRTKKTNKIEIDKMLSIKDSDKKELKIIIKCDTQGSIETVKYSINKLLSEQDKKIRIISSGIGNINENDIMLAISYKAKIIGFNVQMDKINYKISNLEKIYFKCYHIIYDLIQSIKNMLNEFNEQSNIKDKIYGIAEVCNIFKTSKLNIIAGCIVRKGILKNNSFIRILRNNKSIYEGEIESLKHFKENIKEVHTGKECGVLIKNYNNINKGDIIEAYKK